MGGPPQFPARYELLCLVMKFGEFGAFLWQKNFRGEKVLYSVGYLNGAFSMFVHRIWHHTYYKEGDEL